MTEAVITKGMNALLKTPEKAARSLAVSGRSSSGLPDDLLEDARERLFWCCIIYSVAFSLAYGLPRLSMEWPGVQYLFRDVVSGGSIGIALVLAAVLRFTRVKTRLMLDLGLIFEVVGALGIVMSEYWTLYSAERMVLSGALPSGVSWSYIWILSFAAVVPTSPGKTALATLLSAAMAHVVFFASYMYYDPDISSDLVRATFVGATIGGIVITGMALAMNRIIYSLGRKVTEARRLGSYQLVKQIGKGGMGEVWLGEHRLLARPAAVKLVRGNAAGHANPAASDQLLRRFEREAQATAQLRCPHTIGLYDFGIAADGTFYYVMELLDGLTLEDLVSRYGPLPPERAVFLLRQVCESLQEAHHYSLLHRDIKPANVFCCRYGMAFDFIKVLDFGLVKTVGDVDKDATKLTNDGIVTGTPAYLAPEAILGERELDARIDIYAIGCVAYWLLTANLVFDADSGMKQAMMHVNEVPQPPSKQTELSVPPALDALVLDCLAKQPERRPQNASEVIERLNAIEFENVWTAERAERWWTTHEPKSQLGQEPQRSTVPIPPTFVLPD